MIDISCDVQQIDETGFVWTFLDEARNPAIISPNTLVVAGDDEEPVFALVVDVVGSGADRRVHLNILPGTPGAYLQAAARAELAVSQ